MSSPGASDVTKKGSGTGVFLPRVSVSRPVKWAAAASEGGSEASFDPLPPALVASGSQVAHVLIENAPSSSASHALPNLTPVSSPTAGTVCSKASSMSGFQAHSGTMQLSRVALEEHSSSWSEHLAAAPEVGGWSINHAGTVAGSSSSQPPRSRARMMQMLLQHQQLQQHMQQAPPVPPPPRQDARSISWSSSSAMNAVAGAMQPVPPPPRSRPAAAAADSSTWEVIAPAPAEPAASVPIPASSSHHMQHGYGHSDMPGAAAGPWGGSYDEGQSMGGCGSSGASSRAARAAALATMMTGGEAQPKFWGPGQLPTMPRSMRSSCGSFSGSMTACLQEQQQQHQLVQHSALLPGASLSGCQDSQQLLQLRKQLESDSGTPFDGAVASAAVGQVSAFSAAAMPGAHGSGGGFDAYSDVAGMACMQIPSLSAAGETHASLQLSGSAPALGGGLLQLQMAAAIGDSASQLAALGLDAAGQPLQQHHLQHSEPCLAMYRELGPVNGYDDQPYVGSGSLLGGQGPVSQARMCEVKEKMRQLADVQTVQRQLQEELLACCSSYEALRARLSTTKAMTPSATDRLVGLTRVPMQQQKP